MRGQFGLSARGDAVSPAFDWRQLMAPAAAVDSTAPQAAVIRRRLARGDHPLDIAAALGIPLADVRRRARNKPTMEKPR